MPTKKKTTKKIDTEKWDNYSYWSDLADNLCQKITDKMCNEYGMDFMAKRISTRKLTLFLNAADFTISETTPLGIITAAVYDEMVAIRRKDGGFIFRTGLSMDYNSGVAIKNDAHYHLVGYDTVMAEVVESICDKLGERMRGAYYELKKMNGIKD